MLPTSLQRRFSGSGKGLSREKGVQAVTQSPIVPIIRQISVVVLLFSSVASFYMLFQIILLVFQHGYRGSYVMNNVFGSFGYQPNVGLLCSVVCGVSRNTPKSEADAASSDSLRCLHVYLPVYRPKEYFCLRSTHAAHICVSSGRIEQKRQACIIKEKDFACGAVLCSQGLYDATGCLDKKRFLAFTAKGFFDVRSVTSFFRRAPASAL
jgi:hypothetical protein